MSRRLSFDGDQEPYFNGSRPQQTAPIPQSNPPSYEPPRATAMNPAAHPDSAFNRLRQQRGYIEERREQADSVPIPPPHRDPQGRAWAQEMGYTDSTFSHTTPGADNFGEQAVGGIAGIAYGVAEANARESGLEAMRSTPRYDLSRETTRYDPYEQPSQPYRPYGVNDNVIPPPTLHGSRSSLTPLTAAAAPPPGVPSPQSRSTRSVQSYSLEPYGEQPSYRYSRHVDPNLDAFDPNTIEDDEDEGLEYNSRGGSRMSLAHRTDRNGTPKAAAAGGVLGGLGAFVGRQASGQPGPQYDPVHNGYSGGSINNLGASAEREKSEWLSKQSSGNNKLRWIVGIVVALVIIGGIAGGVIGGIQSRKSSSSSSSTPSGASASTDTKNNGDLNIDSAEIQKLMNNADLHKVFPGIDYTPMYTQYPECLSYPPSQNNVTRDMAVLAQLTNTIRLYGTDCNQTEMVLHSMNQLKLKGTMKVWMGVWQDKNTTTNARQLAQMYDVLKKYGASDFAGVIVGNEVLYREDMTATALGALISEVKSNLTAMDISLPVASSDLGDAWTAELASDVDYLMANIHPFFAGVTADVATSWTWTFWQNRDVVLKSDTSKNIISETGWPSAGGKNCGSAASCTTGSTAGITEMNTFMDDWVCQALANGTNYFWFEAFDEPWKITFNTPGKEWEDQWGLMDVNRNLKPGVKIPSCGGKTVS